MNSRALRRARGAALIAVLAMLASIFLAGPLGAQTSQSDFEVLRVDLRNETGLVTVRSPEIPEPLDVGITAGGQEIPTSTKTLANSRVDSYTVIIVDDSANADVIAGFSRVRQAAITYLNGLSAGTKVMLVRGGGGNPDVEAVVNFTSDHTTIRNEIEALTPGGASVLWNSIARSAEAIGQQPDGVRNVVAFVASPGGASTIPATVAQGNLLSSGAGLTIVAPQAPNTNLSSYVSVANSVRGGGVFRGDESSTMVDAAAVATVYHRQTYVASFDSADVPDGSASFVVSLGGLTERVRATPGSLNAGAGLQAPEVATTSRFDVLRGDYGAIAAIGLGVVAALLFSFAMMSILAGNDNSLNSTLAVYASDDNAEEKKAADDAFASVRSRIVEQVVERAESAAESRGSLQSTTSLLEKAEIPLRAGEAMAVQVGVVIVSMLLGFVLFRHPLGALVLAVPGAVAPVSYVKFKVRSRRKKLEKQLPDTLTLLSSTLKAGYSFLQGIDAVGNEAEEPLAGEFRRTVNEARLGRDMDDALDDLAERVGSTDLLWAVVAIKIQREVGGNLAELLSTVAETMTARTRLRGEIAALTAEGRMSAYVLIFLPIGVGLAMWFLNPDYIATLWTHPFGYIAIGAGVVGIIVGSAWMRKIIDIKI